MEQIDAAIIGAGVVGLAIASEVAKDGREVYVLEKHETFGRETSDRNSEVIHAGVYYDDSTRLKGELDVEGKHLIYEISEKHGVPAKRLGKLLVATEESELPELEKILKAGRAFGVTDLVELDRKQIKEMEPNVEAVAAVYSPSTGIVSAHDLMKYFIKKATAAAGINPILYESEVVGIDKLANGYKVTIQDSNGNQETIGARVVVNSAGLGSDKIAELAGIDADAAGYRLHYCKGRYFSLSYRHRGKVSRLVYPVPGHAGKGIHITLDLGGGMKLGPDTEYIPRHIDYTVDPALQKKFYEATKPFLPFIEYDDLQPDQAGIRPKLFGPGQPKRDFVIREESARGLPGLINLIGIESPGLTASPAIGRYVGKMVDEVLGE
ncbi:NAD(P)/FAD-dependent oxidoreductase [Candidatus Woesearchaeota archaeon]|nr:NAD(P)/FAD-dependent oxidoreductase [Candidatus Woesearchaeota archaeon]